MTRTSYKHAQMGVVVAVLAALMAVFFTPTAQGASAGDRNKAAMAAIASGHYTAADMALIRSQPALAAITPDPTPAGVETVAGSSKAVAAAAAAESVSAADSAGAVAAAVTYCKDYWVTFTQKSLLGSHIYQWQKFVRACYNGSTVRSLVERYDWLPQAQGMIKLREYTTNTTSGMLTWQWNSMLQRHIEYCTTQISCYADTYPWARFKIYGNGTWWYDGRPA